MVTQNIKDAVGAVEYGIDGIDKIASMATTNQEMSQEEIEMRRVANETKKVINRTLSAAVSAEKILHDKSWGNSDWGSKEKTRTEEITW